MRFVVFLIALLHFMPEAQAQDAKQQRINQAIDSAERICLVGNRFKFPVDASGNLTISKLLPGVAGKVTIDQAQAKGSQFFENEDVRRLVDSDIRDCMKMQWTVVLQVMESALPKQYKKIACTGEHEGNCPGSHELFYTCDYIPSDAQIASQICQSAPAKSARLKTVSGNRCGYALIEITCN